MITTIVESLTHAKKVALIAHIMPDGDTIGSCIALSYALESIGCETHLYCQDPIPYNLCFLDDNGRFINVLPANPVNYDAILALDCSDLDRMGEFRYLMESGWQTINIDHHISNTNFAQMNYIDIEAAATCEIVYRLIEHMGIHMDISIARALYVGISTDTGNFAFNNTTSRTHCIAAKLVDIGVRPDEISNKVYKDNSLSRMKLIAKVIQSIKLYANGSISTIEITRNMLSETGASQEESSGMVDYAKNIRGVELAILFKEQEDGQIKISMRSKTTIDCNKLAQAFGGGGHARAAGCILDASLHDTKVAVIKEAKKAF
ncbi:MAG: bifunctional oligoribonuclease/PAP phosphatase NrnA [Clostridiales bacterium]|nr:bifunctional oligoribonuclease/PAP phosphatase NrnA [Clostridiales bacterium]